VICKWKRIVVSIGKNGFCFHRGIQKNSILRVNTSLRRSGANLDSDFEIDLSALSRRSASLSRRARKSLAAGVLGKNRANIATLLRTSDRASSKFGESGQLKRSPLAGPVPIRGSNSHPRMDRRESESGTAISLHQRTPALSASIDRCRS
jgi:hypothetical protein